MPIDFKTRQLGLRDYQSVWDDMRMFNQQRDEATCDEIWLLEHPPVFTLGLNGKPQHIIDAHDIPVIQCDRGGQVTYHGP
ncbi:lipoyl protein ligase domain-containing protein, partial [Kaarinaea lacus]